LTDCPKNIIKVQVYLSTIREKELFERIKAALGEDDTGTFKFLLKSYADDHNLITEHLHNGR